MVWTKGQSGNPNGRARKDSTQIFIKYFNAGKCKELYRIAMDLANTNNVPILCKLLDKLVPNKQFIEMITKEEKQAVNYPITPEVIKKQQELDIAIQKAVDDESGETNDNEWTADDVEEAGRL